VEEKVYKLGGLISRIFNKHEPPQITAASVLLAASNNLDSSRRRCDPQLGLILDELEQIGHLGVCSAEAPGISFLPKLPSDQRKDGIGTLAALSRPLSSPDVPPVEGRVCWL